MCHVECERHNEISMGNLECYRCDDMTEVMFMTWNSTSLNYVVALLLMEEVRVRVAHAYEEKSREVLHKVMGRGVN